MFPRLKAYFRSLSGDKAGNIAILPMHGPIMAGKRGRQGMNLESMERQIAKAFTIPDLKAVALSINSPGGSPVQSAMIMDRILDLAKLTGVPVIAFTEDIAASGGYMIALSADEIIAHPASLVGSIGVIYSGFGLSGVLKKYGVERRVHTAGKSKSFMDPFCPEKKADVDHLKSLQNNLFKYFQDLVIERRGKRLKGPKTKVFSGLVWTGEEALKLGVIDGIGDMSVVLKERFGEKVRFIRIAPPKSFLGNILGNSSRAGSTEDLSLFSADELLNAIEARLHWSRWGL